MPAGSRRASPAGLIQLYRGGGGSGVSSALAKAQTRRDHAPGGPERSTISRQADLDHLRLCMGTNCLAGAAAAAAFT